MTREELQLRVHSEVAKYASREFLDTEDLVTDVGLLSDDLTAVALSLETFFNVRIERRKYRDISNVADFADLIHKVLNERLTYDL